MLCHVFTHISSIFFKWFLKAKIPYNSRIAFLQVTVRIIEFKLLYHKQANIQLFTLPADLRVYKKPIIFASIHQIVDLYAFAPRGNISI